MRFRSLHARFCALLCAPIAAVTAAQAVSPHFQFPTANKALLTQGGEPSFYVGTAGKPWTSGQFGCVRSEGHQMHEGLDIRCLRRDANGEPNDPVNASLDGTVVYISSKPGLSNYGNYIILSHSVEGVELYTLYAHLREARPGLRVGQKVRAGENIATMGRTSNTRQRITQDRAHVHFEINLLMNPRFDEWNKRDNPGQRNDHGMWNGLNLVGIDPAAVFKAQAAQGKNFSILDQIRNQTELCRVLVRNPKFAWVKRYTPLIRRNPQTERDGIAGFEVALNFNGVPYQLTPRSAAEIQGRPDLQVLSVNAAEAAAHGCRHLVQKVGAGWDLTAKGRKHFALLTY